MDSHYGWENGRAVPPHQGAFTACGPQWTGLPAGACLVAVRTGSHEVVLTLKGEYGPISPSWFQFREKDALRRKTGQLFQLVCFNKTSRLPPGGERRKVNAEGDFGNFMEGPDKGPRGQG